LNSHPVKIKIIGQRLRDEVSSNTGAEVCEPELLQKKLEECLHISW